jgi:hypothetical protein
MHTTVAKYTWGFSEKLKINSLLRKPTCRWRDNIKINLKEIRWQGMD